MYERVREVSVCGILTVCVRKRVASCEGERERERERERGVNYLHQSRTKSSFDQKNVELQKFPKIEFELKLGHPKLT